MNTNYKLWLGVSVLLAIFVTKFQVSDIIRADEGIFHTVFTTQDHYLVVELLDDDLAHFEYGVGIYDADAIWTTPMVAKTDYAGPSSVNLIENNVLETPELRLEIDEDALCVTVTDIIRTPELMLSTFCPFVDDDQESSTLSFTQEGITDLYGLGEQFQRRGGTEGNWIDNRRLALNTYGNELRGFNGGNVGNAQFPILYALGEATDNYAVFLDDVYHQHWDFREDPFTVTTTNSLLRWYIMSGTDLPDLRRDYMELTGHAPVPPRQTFGLWVSEYGYESWDELIGVLESLLEANFPLDGFVMDLQWFGGIGGTSQMGSLTWDETNFPNPSEFIANLRDEYGIGIMVIEESYVAVSAENYPETLENDVLVLRCPEADCEPIRLTSWWGTGGMVDWTNPSASAWWHDERRQHLIDSGVMAHWTDLGEPEDYDDSAWYYGFPEFELHDHADIHNLYNFLWSQSIWEGYQRNEVLRRPFILSRSGTSGTQRFGVAMWSGDIAANMPSLEGHMNVQMHMSLSGVDYFGSDIGGFFRNIFDPVLGEEGMYTTWLANSVLLDVPLRPHAMNLQNLYSTAPSMIGDVDSNLANVRLRYALSPYLYTQAHRAYRDGEPVFAPMVYYFQDDPVVRTMGSQKMIGADLMMATITGYDTDMIPVYLPAGGWFNYYTNEFIQSVGEWVDVPSMVDGVLRAPLFVRDGAIIPHMIVADQTMNMLGQGVDGTVNHDLVLHVYAHNAQTGDFTLIEDDGETVAYQVGAVQDTPITYTQQDNSWLVEIAPANGTYPNAPQQRTIEIRLITPDAQIGSVEINGEILPESDWSQDEVSGAFITSAILEDISSSLQVLFRPQD